MACELCRGGDAWIKTCLTLGGSRIMVCDFCYGEHGAELTIVPGDRLVTARCDLCRTYGNPREFSDLRLGGRKGAYSGTCAACTGGSMRGKGAYLMTCYRLDRGDPDI